MKVFGGIAAVASAAQIAYVSYDRRQRKETEFKKGGADEVLMDNLQPGDILLFERSSLHYWLPKAICMFLHKSLLGASLDNCGVIVMDKLGRPHVFELSSDGYRCTPYAQRILRSTSKQILLVPLERSLTQDEQMRLREKSYTYAQDCLVREKYPNELQELIFGALAAICAKSEINSPYLQHPFSPSVQCVLDVMTYCDISLSSRSKSTAKCTCDDLHRHRLVPAKGKYRFNESVVIRGL